MLTGLEVAVVGVSCETSGDLNEQNLFSELLKNKELIKNYTTDELAIAGIELKTLEKETYIKTGGSIDISKFDFENFGFERDENELIDPQLKLLLRNSKNALSNCNISGNKVGVYLSSSSSYKWKNYAYAMCSDYDAYKLNRLSLITDREYYASQVSYRLNLQGPSIMISSACSSSALSIHQACRALIIGECDLAIAGGVHAPYPLKTGYFYDSKLIFSKSGHCKTFDKDADGTVPSCGVGILVLKELSKAIEDKDEIYGIIKSSYCNNDGNRKAGFTVPSLAGQTDAVSSAYELAELDLDDVDFIETHGTGTLFGDSLEVESLKRVFADVDSKNTCALSSIKPNIGYTDTASGVLSVIKSLMSIKSHKLPANINLKNLNTNINLDDSPFFINRENIDLNKNKPLIAGVSSFGDGGTNVHIVLQEFVEGEN